MNVCKKLCNDIVNPTDLWSSISLISETGSLKVTLSGRVPGNIKSIPPINCGHKGPTFRARKSHFVTKRKFLYKLGSLNCCWPFFLQQPNKNRWPPLPWLSICQRTFLSNNFIPLLLKNFSRKGEVWRELSLNVLIQFGGERKRVQSIFNHQTLWNNMLDDFPSWKIQISHF